MNTSIGFKTANITLIHLNALAFDGYDMSKAFIALEKPCPNAEHTYSYFHEVENPGDPLPAVLYIEPYIEDEAARYAAYEAVERIIAAFIAKDPHQDQSVGIWEPGNPEAWKTVD